MQHRKLEWESKSAGQMERVACFFVKNLVVRYLVFVDPVRNVSLLIALCHSMHTLGTAQQQQKKKTKTNKEQSTMAFDALLGNQTNPHCAVHSFFWASLLAFVKLLCCCLVLFISLCGYHPKKSKKDVLMLFCISF